MQESYQNNSSALEYILKEKFANSNLVSTSEQKCEKSTLQRRGRISVAHNCRVFYAYKKTIIKLLHGQWSEGTVFLDMWNR